MLQNATDQQTLSDETDDLHHLAAFWAFQRINFPDLLDHSHQILEGIFFVDGSVMVRTSVASVVVPAFK
jgi:hypothetical protein